MKRVFSVCFSWDFFLGNELRKKKLPPNRRIPPRANRLTGRNCAFRESTTPEKLTTCFTAAGNQNKQGLPN